MVDHEITINGLHEAKCLLEDRVPERFRGRALYAVEEAMEFLKPVRPETEGSGNTWWYVCGECHTSINPNAKYCHQCGKRVDWHE